MKNTNKTYFLDTINHLRKFEEVILYNQILNIPSEEDILVIKCLEYEYNNECLEYPYLAPPFDAEASLWGAKIVYMASQLLLYRKNRETEIQVLLPEYLYNPSISSILSADLTLRFLPDIIENMQVIDPDDKAIEILINILQKWHYSGIGSTLNIKKLNFETIFSDNCTKQLYINRIIAFKAKHLAELPNIKTLINESTGNYTSCFWKDL